MSFFPYNIQNHQFKILSLAQTTKCWTSYLGNISLFGTCNLSFAYLNQLAIWVFCQ